METGNQRLRLLTEHDRDLKVAAQRLSHRSKQRLACDQGRNRMVASLRELARRRDTLAASIDIEELWMVLSDDPVWIDLDTMTGLCFPASADDDHESAVIRAMFRSRRHFKFRPGQFMAHTETEVAAVITAEERAAHRQHLIDSGAAWIQSVRSGSPQTPPCRRELIEILQSYYLQERESPHAEIGRTIMNAAGLTSPEAIFNHLVSVGVWDTDENVDILRFNIPTDFPAAVLDQAQTVATTTAAAAFKDDERVDLTHLSTITIDGQSTQDFDDALSIEIRDDHYLVGIHISDVAQYIRKGDLLDETARSRGSSIYMPDARISMAPPLLAENRLSLRKGQLRPTISTMVKFSRSGDIISYDIFPAVIRVDHQLTYFEANVSTEGGDAIETLHDIALRFREKRLAQGALQIILPEISVWLDESGLPVVNRVNRESPGRLLIAEMMILANWLSARFLAEKGLPAIFRSQPKPKERILKNGTGTLFQNWMQRKLLNRFVLRPTPDHHCGLGLDAYVTATSPIRKYFDLVTQRQIRAALGIEQAYKTEEIEAIIAQLTRAMADVGRIQFRRNRYWLLKHLEGRIGDKEEAIVLQRRRNTYTILLKAYMIECNLPQSSGIDLKPEDLVQVTIQHVNARSNTLSVFMG